MIPDVMHTVVTPSAAALAPLVRVGAPLRRQVGLGPSWSSPPAHALRAWVATQPWRAL